MLWMVLACVKAEGMTAGDCDDGADNDGDGAFDCADDGCAGAPVCGGEGDADTDADADTDTDTDAPADWVVCADGSGDFEEVQDAVDEADDGDVIDICAGTYEFVTIERLDALVLRGAGIGQTIIDGQSNPAIQVDDSDLELSRLSLVGRGGGDNYTAGLLANNTRVYVHDVALSGVDADVYGFVVNGGESARFERVEITDNRMAHGLSLYGMERADVQHLVVRDNEPFDNNFFTAVNLNASAYELSNSLIVGNTHGSGYALDLRPATGEAWVWNNTVAGNSNDYSQYLVVTSTGLIFENNIVVGSSDSRGGVLLLDDMTLQYNLVYGFPEGNWQDYGDPSMTDNLEVDPRFDDGGWTLSEFSPARDAGNPLEAYNDSDGTRSDMGAFGGPGGTWSP